MDPETFPEGADFISIDVSFISLELVLDVAEKLLKDGGQICALIKPQFEAGKDKVGKGGIVREASVHREVLGKMMTLFKDLDLDVETLTSSPIHGMKGNIEFLALAKKGYKERNYNLGQIVQEAHASGGNHAG